MAGQNTFQIMLLNGRRILGNKNGKVYVWLNVKSMSKMESPKKFPTLRAIGPCTGYICIKLFPV